MKGDKGIEMVEELCNTFLFIFQLRNINLDCP